MRHRGVLECRRDRATRKVGAASRRHNTYTGQMARERGQTACPTLAPHGHTTRALCVLQRVPASSEVLIIR